MLATRKFWFQPPVKYDPEWTDYLEQYKAQTQPWPHVPPSLPLMIPPQDQTEYPMQHGDSTLECHLMR